MIVQTMTIVYRIARRAARPRAVLDFGAILRLDTSILATFYSEI